MDINFILTQAFGFVALIIICFSYFVKSKEKFLLIQIIANFFYATAFLFQGLFVAGIGTYISLLRTFGFYYLIRKGKQPDLHYLFIIFAVYFINTSLFYQSPADFIALGTSCVFTVAYYVKNMTLTRYMMIIPNLILCIYNICNLCYTNAILDGIETLIAIISSFTMKEVKESI